MKYALCIGIAKYIVKVRIRLYIRAPDHFFGQKTANFGIFESFWALCIYRPIIAIYIILTNDTLVYNTFINMYDL